jgi:hypothetical protein
MVKKQKRSKKTISVKTAQRQFLKKKKYWAKASANTPLRARNKDRWQRLDFSTYFAEQRSIRGQTFPMTGDNKSNIAACIVKKNGVVFQGNSFGGGHCWNESTAIGRRSYNMLEKSMALDRIAAHAKYLLLPPALPDRSAAAGYAVPALPERTVAMGYGPPALPSRPLLTADYKKELAALNKPPPVPNRLFQWDNWNFKSEPSPFAKDNWDFGAPIPGIAETNPFKMIGPLPQGGPFSAKNPFTTSYRNKNPFG